MNGPLIFRYVSFFNCFLILKLSGWYLQMMSNNHLITWIKIITQSLNLSDMRNNLIIIIYLFYLKNVQ